MLLQKTPSDRCGTNTPPSGRSYDELTPPLAPPTLSAFRLKRLMWSTRWKESSMHNVANTPPCHLGRVTVGANQANLSRLKFSSETVCRIHPPQKKQPQVTWSESRERARDHGGNKLHARSRFVPVNARKPVRVGRVAEHVGRRNT